MHWKLRSPFLPTCCSSAAGVSPMLSCSRLNRCPFGRNQSRCGGRMHVLTPTERTKTLCYLAISRSCNRAQENTCPRRLSVFYDVFIVLIYIFNSILSLRWCAGTQPLARRSQPTVALVHYGKEGQPTVAPMLHGKRARPP